MMAKESRPGGGSEAAESVVATQDQDTRAPRIPRLSQVEIDGSRPMYVIVVKGGDERLRRRVFLSLHSAVRAVERARERGDAATLELCRVLPVGYAEGVSGDE
jgi:hypothetical protein